MAEVINTILTNKTIENELVLGGGHGKYHNWMYENWTVGFHIVGIYVLFIFGAQQFMKSRTRFSFQRALVIWNVLLAGFSIYGTFQIVPEMLKLINGPNGFYQSVCSPIDQTTDSFRLWIALFVYSKAPELGDTVFIVLRKQPLIFLHWYHHITVLLYTWYSYAQYIAPSRWFIGMNFFVHALMYSYYALRALKFKTPKFVSVIITSLQIAQMFVGVGVNLYAAFTKLGTSECEVPLDNIFWALAMYGSYFYLFVQFFNKSYLGKVRKGRNFKAKRNENKSVFWTK